MTWFRGQYESDNEFGEYLPDEESEQCEESERIVANNQQHADEKCAEVAKEYGGTNPKARPIGKKLFDCKFNVWR